MEKQKLDFLIDTSASYLVVNTPATELSHICQYSQELAGNQDQRVPVPLSCKTAQFLYLAEICYASYKIKSSSTLRNVRFVSKCLQNTDCSCEHFWQALRFSALRPCQSYNTPVLLVKETHSHEYRFMQDLRAINDIVEDIHPTVANPYTTFASLPGNHE
ncbi:Gag-Pol polyprotein [Plecturocebus cupreus]